MELEIPEAFSDLVFTKKRYKVYHGGRGGAKSESFARALLAQAMSERMGVLCAREIQKSIKDSVHRLLKEIITSTPEFNDFFKAFDTEIKGRNGSFFIFYGLKHNIVEIKSLKGIKRCWVEEAQAVSDKSWETLIPTIREEDSEIWISFNEKNATDPTYLRFVLDKDDDMIVRKVSYRDNPYFPQVLENERLKLKRKDPEAYEHVWEGGFDTRHSGKVYAKYIKPDQLSELCVYDPGLPVYTAWDLGYDDATSIIWYQLAPGEIRIVDTYECNFQDPLHYCEQLYGCKIIVDERDARTGKIKQWHFGERIDEDRAGYIYIGGRHYAPHDAANKLMAAGGRSIVEQCMELGILLESIPAATHQNCEAALRGCLDRVWFNKAKAKDCVHALMSYHYDYDEDLNIFSKEPVHDWSSHYADACELMARMWQDTGKSTVDIARAEHDARFHRLRAQNKLDNPNPYAIQKSTRDKRYAGRRPGGRVR
jgi:phage terminase large subunit